MKHGFIIGPSYKAGITAVQTGSSAICKEACIHHQAVSVFCNFCETSTVYHKKSTVIKLQRLAYIIWPPRHKNNNEG